MYQNIFVDKKENIVYIWDDQKGLLKIPFRNYAYRKSPNGIYRSIYGDKLTKIYNFQKDDATLFEFVVPETTRVLVDMYSLFMSFANAAAFSSSGLAMVKYDKRSSATSSA